MTTYFKSVDGLGGGGVVIGGSHSVGLRAGAKVPTAVVIGTGFGGARCGDQAQCQGLPCANA